MNRIKALGLAGLSLLTLCSCGSENEWKYPDILYVESFTDIGYGNKETKNYVTFFTNSEHSKARYRYDGDVLTVRESKEEYTASLVGGYTEITYLGTWGSEKTYEYVGCRFWATFKMEEKK